MSDDAARRIHMVIAQLQDFEDRLRSLQERAESAVGGSASQVDRTMVEAIDRMRKNSREAQQHLTSVLRLMEKRVRAR